MPPANRILVALGFVMAHEAIDTAIVGTHNPQHMQMNMDWLANALPISANIVSELQQRFDDLDKDWGAIGLGSVIGDWRLEIRDWD